MKTQTNALQVLVQAGLDEVSRADLGFRAALAAASCGSAITIFLSNDGAVWGCRHRQEGASSTTQALVDELFTLGAKFECCSICAEMLCEWSGGAHQWGGLRNGVEPVGLVTFMSRAASGMPTLTF